MRYAIYADLPRQLTSEERSALFEALDSTVPGSGCVGPQRRPHDEVFFEIDARSVDEAREQSASYMTMMLRKAALETPYTLDVQAINRG